MPPQPKHKAPIIDAAVRLFRRQGYSSTGLNDIVELSGAPKGSLYHYFPNGKASIAVAAIEEAGIRVIRTLEKLAAETSSTGDFLTAHAALLSRWLKNSAYRDGCPITTVILELAPKDRAITSAGRKAYASRLSLTSIKLQEDGFSTKRADRLAVLCTSTIQGALVQARIDRSNAPLMDSAEELSLMLRSSIQS